MQKSPPNKQRTVKDFHLKEYLAIGLIHSISDWLPTATSSRPGAATSRAAAALRRMFDGCTGVQQLQTSSIHEIQRKRNLEHKEQHQVIKCILIIIIIIIFILLMLFMQSKRQEL